jgi:hypothetical protein
MMLFTVFLLWRSVVATTDVVVYPIVLLISAESVHASKAEMDSERKLYSLDHIRSQIVHTIILRFSQACNDAASRFTLLSVFYLTCNFFRKF